MQRVKTQEEAINNYEYQADQIIRHMYKILMRAQRKNDDSSYRNALERLQVETKNES